MQLPGPIGSFFSFEQTFTGGVRVAASDINGDGQADILASQGPGGQSNFRGFNANSSGDQVEELLNVTPLGFGSTGLFVAGTTKSPSSSALRLAEGFSASAVAQVLNISEVEPVFDAALTHLQAAGVSPETIAELSTITIQVGELSGDQLGEALLGRIVLDVNATGLGWFVDPTPDEDEEFARENLSAIDPLVAARIDLLTVILHELGHYLGADDFDGNDRSNHVMAETLAPGQRRLPTSENFDQLFANSDRLGNLLLSGIM